MIKKGIITAVAAGCSILGAWLAPQAAADPYAPINGDPHIPNIGQGWCPGGNLGIGARQVCAGVPFPDGTFYIQKLTPDPTASLWGGLRPICARGNTLFAVIAPDGCNG